MNYHDTKDVVVFFDGLYKKYDKYYDKKIKTFITIEELQNGEWDC